MYDLFVLLPVQLAIMSAETSEYAGECVYISISFLYTHTPRHTQDGCRQTDSSQTSPSSNWEQEGPGDKQDLLIHCNFTQSMP